MAPPLLKDAMNGRKQLGASERQREEALCRSILEYLQRHPDAEDTLEGIAQWWLLEQRIRIGTTQVKAALRCLVEQKRVCLRPGLDGRIFYRLKS